jgi:hypothetical protein
MHKAKTDEMHMQLLSHIEILRRFNAKEEDFRRLPCNKPLRRLTPSAGGNDRGSLYSKYAKPQLAAPLKELTYAMHDM